MKPCGVQYQLELYMSFRFVAAALSAAFIFGAVEARAAAVTLEFPSADSQTHYVVNPGVLGAGGNGKGFLAGDTISETFTGTGLAQADSAHWIFQMSNFTLAGVNNTFDVRINGVTVDTFNFLSTGDSANDLNFDFTSTFAPIAGDTYTLAFVATSSVPGGLGAWNYYPGGNVTLSGGPISGAIPEPSAWALMILGFGAAGAGLRARRRLPATA
jgi:hypothetical protein